MKRSGVLSRDRIRNEGDLVAYLVDCTLATVTTLAMKKSRPKFEYERQKSIAQLGIDKMIEMGIDVSCTRAVKIIAGKMTVDEYAREFEV